MSDELNSRSLLWANLSIERIDRALRQYKRLQKAWRKMSDEQDRVYEEHGEQTLSMPQSWTDLRAKFEDHVYFFILTSRQALKASWVLEQRDEQMPHFRQQDRLRAWRDYLEHWDNLARRKRDSAGEDWRNLSDEEEPGLSESGTNEEVTRISGVKIKRLRKDLKKARKAARLISEREFDHIYITAAEAAEILGISLEEFEDLDRKPTHTDFGEDIGVRYWRDWTEAWRDGRLIPPGWNDYISADR